MNTDEINKDVVIVSILGMHLSLLCEIAARTSSLYSFCEAD